MQIQLFFSLVLDFVKHSLKVLYTFENNELSLKFVHHCHLKNSQFKKDLINKLELETNEI